LNIKFLGDAFDHWKGSVLGELATKGLLVDLVVEPMITDMDSWSEKDLLTYARLLKLPSQDSIIRHDSSFIRPSETYFDKIPSHCDTFFDPDTGVKDHGGKPKHIKTTEIQKVLDKDANKKRVLIVYQHSSRKKFAERLDEVTSLLRGRIPKVHTLVYECGQVAMIFISYNATRITSIKKDLLNMLEGVASERIWEAA
jgi:hypothetical protein